jgi:uncharacterized protein
MIAPAKGGSMPEMIRLSTAGLTLSAELNDTPSARALLAKLPLEIVMTRWGEEYYGDAGLAVAEEPGARTEMQVGELAVWPEGRAFCIFFGPTPVSRADEPRAYANVNPIGRILWNVPALKELGGTIRLRLERPAE